MKYMRNSSEVTLLPDRQLRLLVYQKMCSSRLSALQAVQGVWLGLRIVLVLKRRIQLKMELLKHQREEIAKNLRLNRAEVPRMHLSYFQNSIFNIQRSSMFIILDFQHRRTFYRTKAYYKSLQTNTLHCFYHRLQAGFVQNFKPFWCHL